MVTRIVKENNVGDLRSAGDWFGIEDDRVMVRSAGGDIVTMAGNDLVDVSQALGEYFQAVYLGFGNDVVYGGGGAEFVHDGDGNDVVMLGAGDDTAGAGAGNDVLMGGAGSDVIEFRVESFNATEVAVNFSAVRLDLARTTAQNLGAFGIDTVTGFESVIGGSGSDAFYGATGINSLFGGDGNDLLDGRAGNDVLDGGYGNDTLAGGIGNDLLVGDLGGDALIGGAGKDQLHAGAKEQDMSRDRFVYKAISDSGLTVSTRDDIYSFTRGSGATDDRIDLHRVDANPSKPGNQAFSFGSSFHSNKYGEVRVVTMGPDTLVLVDIDRDAAAEMTILVQGVTTLGAGDFIL